MIERLQKRVIGILTDPRAEWPVIAGEPADVASLYRNYIAVLAAVPALGIFLGLARFSVGTAISGGVVAYASALLMPIVAAFIVEKLAPRFKSIPAPGQAGTAQALKLVAYAYTPVWLAGVFYMFLALSPLVLLAALYAVYLFYLGLPPVMRTPQENVVPFMVIAAIAVIAVNIAIASLLQGLRLPYYGI